MSSIAQCDSSKFQRIIKKYEAGISIQIIMAEENISIRSIYYYVKTKNKRHHFKLSKHEVPKVIPSLGQALTPCPVCNGTVVFNPNNYKIQYCESCDSKWDLHGRPIR